MKNNKITEKQKEIISLKNQGYTFEQIGKEIGITEELANVNYHYAMQKINEGIPNKDTELNEEQKQGLSEAIEVIKIHLRELKELDDQELQELSYNPKDLIKICKETADKIGVSFNEAEFI